MIGIIAAMKEELDHVLKHITNKETIVKQHCEFIKGKIHSKQVVVVLAGIGKVNAAITTSLLLDHFPVSNIVNIGVAGGQHSVNHKDVIIGNEIVYHDVDVTSFGKYKHGQIPQLPATFKGDKHLVELAENIANMHNISYQTGMIATGDQFVSNSKSIAKINSVYNNVYAVEMEAAAIAHTAYLYDTPCLIIRSISDVIDDETQTIDFKAFLELSARQSARIALELVTRL